MSPRPGGDVSNSSEYAAMSSGSTGETAVPTRRSAVERALRTHPVLVAAVTYLALTLVGVVHDVWFFQAFRINILDYADLTDVLSSPLRSPVTALLSLVPGLLLLCFGELRYHRPSRAEKKRPRALWNNTALRLATYGTFIFAYAVLVTQLDAGQMSERAKSGAGQRVTLSRSDGLGYGEKPILLGTLGHFFFLYYPSRKVTDIVPLENASRLSVDAATRRENAGDSNDADGGDGGSMPPLSP
jgi:hypothetical protein